MCDHMVRGAAMFCHRQNREEGSRKFASDDENLEWRSLSLDLKVPLRIKDFHNQDKNRNKNEGSV